MTQTSQSVVKTHKDLGTCQSKGHISYSFQEGWPEFWIYIHENEKKKCLESMHVKKKIGANLAEFLWVVTCWIDLSPIGSFLQMCFNSEAKVQTWSGLRCLSWLRKWQCKSSCINTIKLHVIKCKKIRVSWNCGCLNSCFSDSCWVLQFCLGSALFL